MKVRAIMAALAATGLMGAVSAQAAESVEVLHWWTSGGESKAVGVLKDDMTKQGYTWKDFAVAGGAGAAAMTALKTQVISGNAPSAAQIKGPLIQEWADQDVLVNIDSVAKDENWKKNLPAVAMSRRAAIAVMVVRLDSNSISKTEHSNRYFRSCSKTNSRILRC